MSYPSLVRYATIAEYQQHFEAVYCRGPILTFDGIAVRFRRSDFGHAFFESSRRNAVKDAFSVLRSERIDWIKAALQDPCAELYVGWDRKKKVYSASHRVCVVVHDYVVVIRLYERDGALIGSFVTAYVADTPSTLWKIRTSPKWGQKKNR